MANESILLKNNIQTNPRFMKYFNSKVLLGLVLLLGAILRFYDLGAESYWIDEMSTVIEGQQSVQQLLASGRLDQPPAFYLPFHAWINIFGTTEMSTRFFSALIGLGSIVVIYVIGQLLFNKEVGLLSALFMAISEYQIYYSQVARFYSFFELTTLLSFLFLSLALRQKKLSQFILYTVFSILMVYSHTYGVFVLAAQNLFVLLQIKKYRNLLIPWILCQALIFLMFIPYMYPLLFSEGNLQGTLDSNVGNLSKPSITEPLRSIYHFLFTARRDRGWGIIFSNYAVAGIVFVIGLIIYIVRTGMVSWVISIKESFSHFHRAPDGKNILLLIFCWLGCPIALPFILSWLITPLYKDYYMISAAPAFYLLVAYVLFNIRKVIPLIISLGVLVLMIAPSLRYYYVTEIHEDWREAASYVEENSELNDVILILPNMGIGIQQKSFEWYYQGNLPTCGLRSGLVDINEISDVTKHCFSGSERAWVIIADYPTSLSDDRYRSYFLNPEQSHLTIESKHEVVSLTIYLFDLLKK